MMKPRLVLCSGADIPPNHPLRQGRHAIELDTCNADTNTHLRLENVTDKFARHLSPRIIDLLELATYIFTADCSTKRDLEWTDDKSREPWSRSFHFVMPVRDLSFWKRDDVQRRLIAALAFLSSDTYTFDFVTQKQQRDVDGYLQITNTDIVPFQRIERVTLFSGGLDSLAGAVEAAHRGEKLVLVSHRPVSKIDHRQQELARLLKDKFRVPILHIPVWVNKKGNDAESTQRTRSFLFAALGVSVASSLEGGGVRFYENGVTSVNLPLADEVTQSRASRTTHPEALQRMQSLFRLVLDNSAFVIDNPFIYQTKTDIVSTIGACGAGDLIEPSCSCTHTMFQSNTQRHCGLCGQCIDRRIAILAAGMGQYETEGDYLSDVFTGRRDSTYEHNIALNYIRVAREISRMTENMFVEKYNTELNRAVRFFPNCGEAAQRFFQMYKRHANTVCTIVDQQVKNHSRMFVDGEHEPSSMLAMIGRGEHLAPIIAQEEGDQAVLSELREQLDGNCLKVKGEYWDICYRGERIQLKDSKGLHYIAMLMQNPAKEFEALHLVLEMNGVLQKPDGTYTDMSEEQLAEYNLNRSGVTGTGEVMDPEYEADVRLRIREMKEQRDIADAMGDTTRTQSIDDELAQYYRALGEGIGLGGRHRMQGNPAEKARVSVTQAVGRVMKKLRLLHPDLFEHLDSSLRRGAQCCYSPAT